MQVREIGLVAFILWGAAFFTSCASAPKPTKFDGKWQFCEIIPREPMACLNKEDVKRLREVLIRCESAEVQ